MKKITFLLVAMLAFTWQANAQNSTCATAAPLTIGGTACAGTSGGANSGDPTGNDDTDGNVCSSSYSGGDDFIFEYTATTTDALKLDLFATNTWTGIMVTEGCPTTGTCFASATSSSINESLTTPAMTIGATYYIHVSTYPSPQSPGQFCIDATLETPATPPANDECADAIGLTVNPDYACGTVTAGTVAGATDSGANDATCYGTPNDDVWYSFTATATDHRVSLTNLVGSTTDMYMTFYDATAGCGSLGASIACSDPQTANLTGLTIGTTYFVQVYSYYADLEDTTFDICVGTPPACLPPTSLSATNLTETSADLGWTENGTADTWDIEWGAEGFTATGTPNIVGTTTNPHMLGGLTSETSYDFYVRADCGGDMSTWTGPYTFTTPGPPPANDTCATAESVTVGDGTCGPSVTGSNNGATDSGEPAPTCGNYSGGDIWYSFVVPTGKTQVTVELGSSDFSTTKMAVYDTTMACGSLVEVFCNNLYTSLDVTGLTSGDTYLLRLYDWSNDDFGDVTFCISTLPACPDPSSLTATNLTETSADLGWTENGTADTWDIEWGAEGFTATGTPNIVGTTTNPHMLGGLTASTSYDFYVRADCGGGDTSAWSGPYTFTTASPPPTCGENFYDDGGASSDYSNSANITTTICPDVSGDAVNVTFTLFSTENNGSTGCFDGLTIHNGPDASSPTINPTTGTIWCWDRDDAAPGGTGDLQGMTITSTDASGCLTFVFTSDSSVTREGWEATVGCAPLSLEDYGLTGFTYFPNPVNNTLSLRGVKDIQDVAVYNMLGQEVLRTAPNTVASDIDMSSLQAGTYFVKVTVENTTKTIKVIKK
jgi:hypothetical protein